MKVYIINVTLFPTRSGFVKIMLLSVFTINLGNPYEIQKHLLRIS